MLNIYYYYFFFDFFSKIRLSINKTKFFYIKYQWKLHFFPKIQHSLQSAIGKVPVGILPLLMSSLEDCPSPPDSSSMLTFL